MDRHEKEEKVDEVIEELGLSHVANSLVTTKYVYYLILSKLSDESIFKVDCKVWLLGACAYKISKEMLFTNF